MSRVLVRLGSKDGWRLYSCRQAVTLRRQRVDTASQGVDKESQRVGKESQRVDKASQVWEFQRRKRQNRTFVYAGVEPTTQKWRGSPRPCVFRCHTKENGTVQEKPKEIKEMTAPGGCVLCGGLKGPAAGLAAGALRAPVSVRGTLTKSEGRPRRRSRWDWTPRSRTAAHPKQKAAH